MFVLKVLGGAALLRGGVPVTGRAVHRRRLALLALLASARGRMVRRERLIGYLWPEHPGDSARHLLSESLYILRKAVGEDMFVSAGDEIALDPATVRSDLADFLAALEADDPEAAVAAYGGPFLDGFVVADAPEFERWAEEERDRHARAFARALEQLAEGREAEGDFRGAAEWWKQLARHDPFSSRIALRTMQALEAGGERAAAIRHATAHAALMRAEMEAEPDAAVEEFALRLREAPRSAEPTPMPTFAAAPGGQAVATPVQAPAAVPDAVPHPEAAEAVEPQAPPRPSAAPGIRRWLAPALALVAVLAAVVVGLVAWRGGEEGEPVNASVYIVLPFAQRGTSPVTPDQAELLLHDAFSRWSDLQLVDAQRTRDLLSRNGPPESLREARRIARSAGAGKLVWGEITPLGDSIMVRAALYDVARGGDPVESATIRVGSDLGAISARFGTLAWSLLGRTGDARDAAGTTSLAAWQAYQRGRLAMSRWELERAGAELERAVQLDPGYAAAHLWLAQAVAWGGLAQKTSWRENAARALADSAELSGRERMLAGALVALGEMRYPDACGVYERLVARDSSDFAAWFGLGECTRDDQLVVADPTSPSGFRFESSYHRAVQAYSRALRTIPSSHLAFRGAGFARLNELLRTDETNLRTGYRRVGAAVEGFAAYPSLAGDTLAFVPWTMADVAAVRPGTVPPTRRAATQYSRRELRRITLEWTRAFPQSADAHEGLALALEALGELRNVRQGAPSAFAELAQARTLTTDPEQRLRLGIVQVRLWLRVEDFRRARAVADSVLQQRRNPGPVDALRLAPLALLTGRVEQARALLQTATPQMRFTTPMGESVSLPAPVQRALADAMVYSGLGLEPETGETEAALTGLVNAWFEPAERAKVRAAVLNESRRLSFGGNVARVRAAPLETPDFVVEMQQMLARGDAAGARARLASLAQGRGARVPGDVTLDFTYPEAELHLALGDTARALEELDRALLALEAMPSSVLTRTEQTGGLLRAMRLRAQLAEVRGDQRTATRWRTALATLWSGGDARLRRTID
ncbi:BTAD domain-containing putative transcriptional regulator [Longimicrobium sp.]|uniref:BTAD domain-containing putative transcriptional regulator n=1 Tax=Longimicrobium sp. TaxID=2029185 RepID=UPI003B3B12AC